MLLKKVSSSKNHYTASFFFSNAVVCPTGKWGPPGCTNTCSANCKAGGCAQNDGACINGCKDGWTNAKCDTGDYNIKLKAI